MLQFDPDKISSRDMYQYLIGSIAPRPIALVSTVDADGVPNLAPYSFFNAVSGTPPMVMFAPSRRARNGTNKDTFHNVVATKECVINVVPYSMVRQMMLTSVEFEANIDEFLQSGLTPLKSDLVKAFRVAQSPVQMECRVEQILELGEVGGSGNLVLCRVLKMHIDEAILDENQQIDPQKIDLMGRMGKQFYSRSASDVQHLPQDTVPSNVLGFEGLPISIRHSDVLTGNQIAQIANLAALPSKAAVLEMQNSNPRLQKISFIANKLQALHFYAQEALMLGDLELAAKLLLLGEYL